jgi:hypothetical protein
MAHARVLFKRNTPPEDVHPAKLHDLTSEGGLVDWSSVEDVFGGMVELIDMGRPSVHRSGTWQGFTRDRFLPSVEPVLVNVIGITGEHTLKWKQSPLGQLIG